MGKGPEAPGETAGERANAEIAADQYKMAKGTHRIQDDTFKRLMDFREEKTRLAGQANADRQQRMPSMPVAGPNRPNMAVTAAVDRGVELGRGAADTARSSHKAEIDAKLGLAGIARGEQKTAIASMDQLARRETESSIDRARNKAAASAERAALVSQGIGVAANVGAGMIGPQEAFSSTGVREVSPGVPRGPQGIALGDDWDFGSRR